MSRALRRAACWLSRGRIPNLRKAAVSDRRASKSGRWRVSILILGSSILGAALGHSSRAEASTALSILRIDCGEFLLRDDAFLSDTYPPSHGPRRLSVNCYLIRHRGGDMLWDAGLPGELAGSRFEAPEQTLTLRERITTQLGRLGLRPEQIEILGISHYHFDHLSQALDFTNARLAMGAEDVAIVRAQDANSREHRAIGPWLRGERQLTSVSGDFDVFGDGSVIMIATPGHTPGHHSLLVRLPTGPVLLSGDLYITSEQARRHDVPSFNHDRADTLASMDRYDRIRRELGSVTVIQHEPDHDRLLSPVPSARR